MIERLLEKLAVKLIGVGIISEIFDITYSYALFRQITSLKSIKRLTMIQSKTC